MLQHTAAYLLTIRSVLRDLREKFNSIHQLSSVELSNFLTEKTSKLSVIDQQTAAAEKISEKIAEKEHEWALSGSLVENAIFVIWRHLDYYFHSSARPRIGKNFYTKYFFHDFEAQSLIELKADLSQDINRGVIFGRRFYDTFL